MNIRFRAAFTTVLFSFMFYSLPNQYVMMSHGKHVIVGHVMYQDLGEGRHCYKFQVVKKHKQTFHVCYVR